MAIDYKKSNAPQNTTVHDLIDLAKQTGNIYETVAIIGKRANQISANMKSDLEKKLQEFTEKTDNLEEISENREQIEISKYYEKLPKPTLIATKEYEDGKLQFRNITKEKDDFKKKAATAVKRLSWLFLWSLNLYTLWRKTPIGVIR